jgi:solute carrier family 30 (zinc transporter), member 1
VPGAFFNGVFLLALALSIFLQSIERFVHLNPIETPIMVLITGAVGLILNIIGAIVVHGEIVLSLRSLYLPLLYIDHGGHHHGHSHGGSSTTLAITQSTDTTSLKYDIVGVLCFR